MVQKHILATYNDLINEHQWKFTGIKTPVVDQQISEVLDEPFIWYEEPIVIEPEKTTCLRVKQWRCNRKMF